MSNTVIRNFTDLNGPSAKADSSLVVIVNKDGSISLDKDVLQNLMHDRVHSTAISVVRVGEDGRPDDASESDSDEAGRPHVNLTVDGYYVDPNVGEYADDLLSALSVETNSNSLVGFQNDHCYTPLTSPSQCLSQRSNTTSKIENTGSLSSKSVNLKTNIPSSKKITIINQQIIQKGKPVLQNSPNESRIILKGSDSEKKTHLSPFKRVSDTEMSQEPQNTDYKSLSDKNTVEPKNIQPGESIASTDTSSSESPTSDQDSDSDYREKFSKKLSGRPSKNKQLKGIKKIFTKKHGKIKLVREGKILAAPKSIKALKTSKKKSTLQVGNNPTKTLGTKVKQAVVKKIKRKQEEKLLTTLVAEDDIPVDPTPFEQKSTTPKSQKLLLKKEKKTPSHMTALLSDMTSLFSTPDVIRSAPTEYKSATKIAEKPISKKVLLESLKSVGHEFETKPNIDAQFKHAPYQKTYSKQKYVKELGSKITLFKESKDHIDIIPQLDEASLAQLLQEGTAEMLPSSSSTLQDTQITAISKEGMSTSATIVGNPITMNATNLTGPLSPSLDLLAGFKPEEAGLTEDLLMHVAQLVESSENLQEVIDKQVLGKISISESHKAPQISTPVDYDEMLHDDLSPIKVHKIPLPPRKDPILVRRSDGRVITLPPIEAPATRASKRKSQHTPYELPGAVAAVVPSLAPATALAPPIEHSPQLSPQLPLRLTPQEPTRQYSNKKVTQLVTSPQQDKVVAESDDSWNSEDDPDRLWCICKQPHNNRFMICCDRCEDWFHGKCVNITKAMGQQMEEKGVEWTCPNCLKKDRERAQIGKTLTPKVLPSNSRKSADMASKDHTKNLSKIEPPRSSPTASGASGSASACIVCSSSARASSIYCSDACIRRHAQDSLVSGAPGHSPAASRPGQRLTTQATRGAGKPESRVIVFERKTGKLLSGATAPTAENLKQWLLDHPTFEVVRPGTLPSPTKATPSKQLSSKQLATTKLNDASKQLDATKLLESAKQLSTTSPPEASKQLGTKQLNKPPASAKQVLTKAQVMAKQQASAKPQATTKQQVLSKQDITKMLTATKEQASSQQAIIKTPSKAVPAKVQSILKFQRIPRLTQSPQPQQKMLTATPKAVEPSAPVSAPVLKQTVSKPSEIKKTPSKSIEKPLSIKSPPIPTTHRRKDSSLEVQAKPHMTAVEPIRDNVRKALQEQLSIRMSENTGHKFDLEQVKTFAIQTELELYDLFKDVGMKYKAKYRSLMFNIKDRRNLSLWQKICDESITPKQLVRLSPEELASQELAQWRDAEAKHQLELIKKNELDLMNCTKTYVLKTHKGEEVMETKSSAPELDPNVSVEDLVSALNDSAATEPDTELPKNTEHPVLKRHKSSRNKSLSIDSNEYNTDVLKGDRSSRSSKSDSTKDDPSIHLHKALKDSDTKDLKTDKDKNKQKKSMRERSRSRDKTRGRDHRDKSRGRSKHSSSSGDHSRQRSRSRDLSKHRTRSRDRHRRSKSRSPDKEEGTKHRTRSRDRLSSRRRSRSREKAKHRSRSKHRATSKHRRYSTEKPERSLSQQMTSKHRSHSKEIDHNEAEPERPKSANQKQQDIHPEYDPHEPMITSAFSEEDLQKSQDADEEETFGDENLIDATAPSMEHDLGRVTSRHSTRIPASAPSTKVSQLLSAGDDHDQEPSSTVEISPPKVIWNGCINMVDVARFYVAAHQVSGSCDDLEEDLASELDVVGRINPDTVWDYITKMRKTSNKEILVLRLTAANDEEKMQYIALYTYLSTRNRMGVVKVSMAMPVKDFYILPLSGQAPVPGALQPLHPGFEEPRPHLLIGIIVRQRKKLSDLIPAKITRRKSSAAVRSYTPPVSSDVVRTESYTPPSSPARRLTRSRDARALPLPASLSVSAPMTDSMTKTLTGFPALSSSVKDKIAASLAAADDEPYSPGGSDSSSTQQSGASRDKEDIQREMEQLNREIEEQKQQIQNMSAVAIEELDEPYSPSRPMTPPPPASSAPTPAPISMSDISLPSNLQEILANIQKKTKAVPMPSNVGMGDVDMRLLPPLPEMPYQIPSVPAPPSCFPPAPTPSKLSTLSEAELLSMVPDDATPPHKRRRFSQSGEELSDATH